MFYLESVSLVGNSEVKSNSLLEGQLSLALLVSPFIGLKGVANDSLLVETRIEMQSDVSILAEKVDVEAEMQPSTRHPA